MFIVQESVAAIKYHNAICWYVFIEPLFPSLFCECHTGSSISLALSFQILVSLVLVLFIGFSLLNSLAVMQLDSILFMCVGLALAWFEIGAVCTAGHKLHQKVSRFFLNHLLSFLLPKQLFYFHSFLTTA
jgi:hypothetical protein